MQYTGRETKCKWYTELKRIYQIPYFGNNLVVKFRVRTYTS